MPNTTDLSTWATSDLQKELAVYFDLIYSECPCYNVRDMEWFDRLERELERRGVEWARDARIKFYEVEE